MAFWPPGAFGSAMLPLTERVSCLSLRLYVSEPSPRWMVVACTPSFGAAVVILTPAALASDSTWSTRILRSLAICSTLFPSAMSVSVFFTCGVTAGSGALR
jgi:hypothetical protein